MLIMYPHFQVMCMLLCYGRAPRPPVEQNFLSLFSLMV